MKKKKDTTKTLTANERKELRRLELEKEQAKANKKSGDTNSSSYNTKEPASTEETSNVEIAAISNDNRQDNASSEVAAAVDNNGAAVAEPPKRKFPLWAIVAAAVLALAILITGIVIPTVVMPQRRFRHIDNPVVVFRLSTGEDIEIVVFEQDVPNAATNFLHLARIGFFNNTVIFDTNNNFVRFGQFEDTTFRNHRTTNDRFLNRLSSRNKPTLGATNVTPQNQHQFSPFDYRVRQDTAGIANQLRQRISTRGYISNIDGANFQSGVDFQIATLNDSRTIVYNNRVDAPIGQRDSRNHIDLTGQVFGRVTDESLEVLDRIANLEVQNEEESRHPFFNPPVRENGSSVYITRTTVFNISTFGHWRNFNWDNHFMGDEVRVNWITSGGGANNNVRDLRFVRE